MAAPPERLWEVLASTGGDPGRYPPVLLWQARGLVDRLSGGPGFVVGGQERGLRPGDVVDFWQVVEVRPPEALRLRARMRLPGTAVLDLEAAPEPRGSLLTVRTTFDATGPLGNAYWWGSLPAHRAAFALMASRLARLAEDRPGPS